MSKLEGRLLFLALIVVSLAVVAWTDAISNERSSSESGLDAIHVGAGFVDASSTNVSTTRQGPNQEQRRNVRRPYPGFMSSSSLSSLLASFSSSGIVWPAPVLERYADPDAPSSRNIVRTISLDEFVFVYNIDNSNDKSNHHGGAIEDIEWQNNAEDRFRHDLQNIIPTAARQHPGRFPVNPRNQSIWALQGIQITIQQPALHNKTHFYQQEKAHRDFSSFPDESYSLEIPPVIDNTPYIQLHAATYHGVLHGLQTLLQLIDFAWMLFPSSMSEQFDRKQYHGNLDTECIPIFAINQPTPLLVNDKPLYVYRGLLVDTSRHYLSIDLLIQNLNVMAMNKLNVLHWHITDNQAWPYQSTLFPELSQAGAYCPECIYTADDMSRVFREAALRGIVVVLEVDVPGHVHALGASHPSWLTNCSLAEHENDSHRPLDVTQPEVRNFVYALYSELAWHISSSWTPVREFQPLIHVGGDEVFIDCWNRSNTVRQWMKGHGINSTTALWADFELDLLDFVFESMHLRPIVWQEVFDLFGTDVAPSTVVDVWKGWDMSARSHATAAGYDVIVSACWYLDHLDLDWKDLYNCDIRDFNGTQQQKQHVLGGHASMWGERVDGTNFFSRVWPRASAVAETLWSGPAANGTDDAFIEQRLDRFRCRMIQQLGISASPIIRGYCPPTSSTNGSTSNQQTKPRYDGTLKGS